MKHGKLFAVLAIFALMLAACDNPAGDPGGGGDSITWTLVSDDPIDYGKVTGIAYGGGKFVAGSLNGGVAYSTDGINWAVAADIIFDDYHSISAIAYGAGRFVAGSAFGGIAYSNKLE
jgi:hypothetical protein